MSIRRFGANPMKLEDLLNFKAFTPEMVMLLEGAIKARLNMVISGGTGSGAKLLREGSPPDEVGQVPAALRSQGEGGS